MFACVCARAQQKIKEQILLCPKGTFVSTESALCVPPEHRYITTYHIHTFVGNTWRIIVFIELWNIAPPCQSTVFLIGRMRCSVMNHS